LEKDSPPILVMMEGKEVGEKNEEGEKNWRRNSSRGVEIGGGG
jgi:hypothetical protein